MPQVAGFFAGFVGFSAPALGSAAFGGWVAGAAFGSTVVGGLLSKLLTTVAITALQQAVARKPSQGGGITISTTLRGEANPETIILGRYATAGQAICPPYSHGKSNAYLTHVIELCSAPGATLERVIVGDDYVEIGSTPHPDGYGFPVLGDYEGNIWIKYYDGSQSAADPMLVAKYGDHPDRPWGTEMIGSGICYAILTFLRGGPHDLQQVPKYRFEMGGIPLYDPRKDSTAGGDGPQRWGDPATWEQTENAIVIAWNIFRGIELPGGDIWGGSIDLAGLPRANWVAMMNRASVEIDLADGTREPRYRAGIEAALTSQPAAIVDEILKAASAQVADMGGYWRILCGESALPVFAFSDDDILRTKEQELDPFPTIDDTYNAVSAQYPDPESLWETKDAPLRTNADWEVADAFGRRTAELQLPACPYPLQVQRLQRENAEDQRRMIRHIFSLTPAAAGVELLDTVDYGSARNGYDGKEFGVYAITEDLRTCIRKVSLRERDPSDYAWVPGYELPTPPRIPSTPPAPEMVDGFEVDAITLGDADGRPRRPAIRLSWASDILANGIRWEARLQGATEVALRGSTQDVSAGTYVIDGVLPATDYEVRARLITGWPTEWSGWIAVTTDDVRVGAIDLADEVQAAIDAAQARADEAAAAADEVQGNLDAAVAPLRVDIDAAQAELEAMRPDHRAVAARVDALSGALTSALLAVSVAQSRMADAGIYLDPATGTARIEAVGRIDEALSAVSLSLDALAGQIALRATYADVSSAVSEALLDPTQIPVIDDLTATIADVQLTLDSLAARVALSATQVELDGIAATLSTVTSTLDGALATLETVVTRSEFDDAESRLTTVEENLSAFDGARYSLTLTDAAVQGRRLDDAARAS
ncbi:hypothetical protein SAMN05877831_1201, partial [Rhodobacter maris]